MLRNIFDGWHIVILVILVIAIFGWKRLPDAARSLGRSARILKSEVDGMKDDHKSDASGQTVPGQKADPQTPPAQGGTPSAYPQNDGSQSTPRQHSDGTGTGA